MSNAPACPIEPPAPPCVPERRPVPPRCPSFPVWPFVSHVRH
ncbi:hypothetical protein [Pantoea phage Nifs112]|nr:hypothetical protein [Pantoea phage Nifs112]